MSIRVSHSKLFVVFVLVLIAVFILAELGSTVPAAQQEPAKAKRKTVGPLASVITAPIPAGVVTPPAPPAGFSSQVRLGFYDGDQWEPAIASDRCGHV